MTAATELLAAWLAKRAAIMALPNPADDEMDAACDEVREIEAALLAGPSLSAEDVWAKIVIVLDTPEDGAERALVAEARAALWPAGESSELAV